jgi:hypothetical protein
MARQRGWWWAIVLGLLTALGTSVRGADAPEGEPPVPEAPGQEMPGVEPPAAPEAGGENPWSIELDLTYNSRYVWRGINFTDDPVFQPSMTFGFKGMSFNVWGNMDTTGINGNNDEFNELDFTLDYSGSVGMVNYSVGGIYYHFPNTGFPGTQELYVGLGLDVPLSPTLTLYADVDEADGFYGTFAIGHTFENVVVLNEQVAMSVDLSASVAAADSDYNAFYFGVADAALVDAVVSLGLPVTLGDHVTVTPAVNYSNILDDKLAAAGLESNWWTGVSVTIGF